MTFSPYEALSARSLDTMENSPEIDGLIRRANIPDRALPLAVEEVVPNLSLTSEAAGCIRSVLEA